MCPEFNDNREEVWIYNGYSELNRTSISFEISKCDIE